MYKYCIYQLFIYKNDSSNVILLQIRIDKLVDKWSGSIEIGVTTHNPNNLDYPATMTNLRSGTLFIINNKHFLHNYFKVHRRYICISDVWCGDY